MKWSSSKNKSIGTGVSFQLSKETVPIKGLVSALPRSNGFESAINLQAVEVLQAVAFINNNVLNEQRGVNKSRTI